MASYHRTIQDEPSSWGEPHHIPLSCRVGNLFEHQIFGPRLCSRPQSLRLYRPGIRPGRRVLPQCQHFRQKTRKGIKPSTHKHHCGIEAKGVCKLQKIVDLPRHGEVQVSRVYILPMTRSGLRNDCSSILPIFPGTLGNNPNSESKDP